jgi:nucleoid-associated protein YgaU
MAGSGKLERAFLMLSAPSSDGGGSNGSGDRIEFAFNPKEFTIQRTAEWKAKPSKKPALPEFVGAHGASVTLEMFLDASEGGDVGDQIDKLFTCVDPYPKTTKDKPSPPFVSFGWGNKTYLKKAIIKTVSVKYTRFSPSGAPIRAIATITLDELRPVLPGQNPTSGGLSAQASRIITSGDTLASIATEELGTPTSWRAIAEANGIVDSFRIRPGTRIIIPSLEVLTPKA